MSEPSASQSLPKPGDLIAGKYRIQKVIGQGGMGAVFLAQHEILLQPFAVKVLLGEVASSPEAVQRFLNEARNAIRIQGEHVCNVKDCDTYNGVPFMVLEFMDGYDLAKVLEDRPGGRIPAEEAVDYVLQALEAINQAHDLNIVHRDLKPSNLFLHRRPDGSHIVKVLDFGISKQQALSDAPAALTSTKAMLGSPLYMSPEQLRSSKTVGPRADIWALGVILYELVTGAVPYTGENLGELFAAILETDPVPVRARVPEVAPGLEAVIMRCLERKVDDRIPSVRELARALAPFGSPRSANLPLVVATRVAGGASPYAATNILGTGGRAPSPSFSGASQTGPQAGQVPTGAAQTGPGLPARAASTVSAVNVPLPPPGGGGGGGPAGQRYGATTPMPGLMQVPAPPGYGPDGGRENSGEISASAMMQPQPQKMSMAPFIVIGIGLFIALAGAGGAVYAIKGRAAKADAPLPTMDIPSASVAIQQTAPVNSAASMAITAPSAAPSASVALGADPNTTPGTPKRAGGGGGGGGGKVAAGQPSAQPGQAGQAAPPQVVVVQPPQPPPQGKPAAPASSASPFSGRN